MKKIIKCANNSIFMYYINKTTQFRFAYMLKCHKNMPSLIKKIMESRYNRKELAVRLLGHKYWQV